MPPRPTPDGTGGLSRGSASSGVASAPEAKEAPRTGARASLMRARAPQKLTRDRPALREAHCTPVGRLGRSKVAMS